MPKLSTCAPAGGSPCRRELAGKGAYGACMYHASIMLPDNHVTLHEGHRNCCTLDEQRVSQNAMNLGYHQGKGPPGF
jgi:hypothetical protein